MVFCSDGICIYITLFMQQCVDVKDFNVWIVPSDETSTLQIRIICMTGGMIFDYLMYHLGNLLWMMLLHHQ